MIKTFENCSPEYQITIVWFFIFLTLLCMILVIYEGTGKRERKMLLPDSVFQKWMHWLILCRKKGIRRNWKMEAFLRI